MNAQQIYITVSIVVLAAIAVIAVFLGKKRHQKPLSPLAAFAFAFVLAGIIFGDDRLVGYSLMGIGIVLAIVDIIKKRKQAPNP